MTAQVPQQSHTYMVEGENKTDIILQTGQKIDLITDSLSRNYYRSILQKMATNNPQNAQIICDYLIAEQTEINIKNSTKEGRIKVLVWVSNFFGDKLSFKNMTKQDVLRYLNSLASEDSLQKWIGSYNARQIILNKFFRWLYNSDEPNPRKRITPVVMNGIKQLPRKDATAYKNSDLWTEKELAVFLKYCPSKRDRCYLSMANDTSARPHELLSLKIKDIVFKITDDGDGRHR